MRRDDRIDQVILGLQALARLARDADEIATRRTAIRDHLVDVLGAEVADPLIERLESDPAECPACARLTATHYVLGSGVCVDCADQRARDDLGVT